MTYTGQGFKNVPTENANITVTSRHKIIYDDDYALTWDETAKWSIEIHHEKVIIELNGKSKKERFKTEKISLPQQHYSWALFKNIMVKKFAESSNLVTCTFESDTLLRIRVPYGRDKQLVIVFAENMKKVLFDPKTKPTHTITKDDMHYDITIKRPPNIHDESQTLITPWCTGDMTIWIENDLLMTFTNQYWTVVMLQKAFAFINSS